MLVRTRRRWVAAMRIQESSQQGCVVLTLVGRLELAAVPQLQRAILKQLAEQPPAIICDLGQVEAIDPLCAKVFTSIRHPALSWPGTALILCGIRPAVADVLARQGVTRRLGMYPSLDQALANARTRPPWLREQLALGPVPTAARDGRAFVREVCGHWELQGLVEPAALLASELVTLAVVHARSAMELRVELLGRRLHVAVKDQDPNLLGLLAPMDGTDQGLHLLIVDQVATAWGVRQDPAGGKTAWCTLELPPPQAARDAGGRRQLPAMTAGAAVADGTDGADRGPSRAPGLPGPERVWSKLAAPAPRAGLIPRTDLQALLQTGLGAKLCLLDAPAGAGKTTLLAQWRATAGGGGRVAWVSLDEGDNDSTRFWTYVVEALRTVEPDMGADALDALRHPSADLHRAVLPGLLNELSAAGSPLFLVLDDYHLITSQACHQALAFFLDHLPAGVHLVLSGRTDPPLPLSRMRVSGDMAEIRVGDLQFTGEEALELLNGAMGLQLAADDVERLVERTEGWAAGLYLAGLSLRGRQDPSAFIAAFHGENRHIADYLGEEVLARQPDAIRTFLLHTSILERLSGPLCDAVLETQGSARLLQELEHSNLFLVPLDDRRQWYRYHHLFAQLLRLELGASEPAQLPLLHQRAAAWHRQAGNLDEAIGHASAAGDFTQAAGRMGCRRRRFWPIRQLPMSPPGSAGTAAPPSSRPKTGWPLWGATAPREACPTASARREACRTVSARWPSGPTWPAPRWCSTTSGARWLQAGGRWSSPAPNPYSSGGWPSRPSAMPCTWPGRRPRPGRSWRSWSGACRRPDNRSRSSWRWQCCRCSLVTRTTTAPPWRWLVGRRRPPTAKGSAPSRCAGSPTRRSGGRWHARASWPRPRSSWSGRWRRSGSTACWRSERSRCCCWRRCAGVEVTSPAPGPWFKRPAS